MNVCVNTYIHFFVEIIDYSKSNNKTIDTMDDIIPPTIKSTHHKAPKETNTFVAFSSFSPVFCASTLSNFFSGVIECPQFMQIKLLELPSNE